MASFYDDMSWSLLSSFVISLLAFFTGVHGPKAWVLPLMGGLTWRPIPYQITGAGDVLLNLELANELIPKADVTFPCECMHHPVTFCHRVFNIHMLILIQLLNFSASILQLQDCTFYPCGFH